MTAESRRQVPSPCLLIPPATATERTSRPVPNVIASAAPAGFGWGAYGVTIPRRMISTASDKPLAVGRPSWLARRRDSLAGSAVHSCELSTGIGREPDVITPSRASSSRPPEQSARRLRAPLIRAHHRSSTCSDQPGPLRRRPQAFLPTSRWLVFAAAGGLHDRLRATDGPTRAPAMLQRGAGERELRESLCRR